jgi:hypothetical protein
VTRPNLREIRDAVDVIDRAVNKKHWMMMIRSKGMPDGNTEFTMTLTDPKQHKKFVVWKKRLDNTP